MHVNTLSVWYQSTVISHNNFCYSLTTWFYELLVFQSKSGITLKVIEKVQTHCSFYLWHHVDLMEQLCLQFYSGLNFFYYVHMQKFAKHQLSATASNFPHGLKHIIYRGFVYIPTYIFVSRTLWEHKSCTVSSTF